MGNYTSDVAIWQDSILSLGDKDFFNLIRLYLGEVKTPYNKQRLIEQLAGFIKNENNTQVMLSYLDSFDLEILTALTYIENVDKNKLYDFFKEEYTFSALYTKLLNLQERLIIFQVNSTTQNQAVFKINPLIQEKLNQFINISVLIPIQKIEKISSCDNFYISPTFIASFISYIQIKGCSGKLNGKLKKTEISHLDEIFFGKTDCIQLLLTSFINLSLIFEGQKNFEINKQKLSFFAQLPFIQQCALICCSSSLRWGKDSLQKQSQFFLRFLNSIPESGLTKENLFRMAFIIKNSTAINNEQKLSRFSRILQSARKEDDSQANDNTSFIDLLIEAAIQFGLIQEHGITSTGQIIYTKNDSIQNAVQENNNGQSPKVVNIDSTYSVSIMPGLSLKELLPLMSFLSIKKSGLVSEFEITRQSVSKAFDNDFTPEDIFIELEKYTYYELPQNLKMNVTEWYNTYSSAVIYKGFVLKVRESNIPFVEKNPNIQKYIQTKLGEGIYLLNIPLENDISVFLQSCGLDFMGTVKTPEVDSTSLPFPLLQNEQAHLQLSFEQENERKNIETKAGIENLQNLKAKLNSLDLTENQKESLGLRIKNKLILSEKQLHPSAIRSEIQEAEGMDYNGKIHLLETAIKEEIVVEIQLPSYSNDNESTVLIGKPIQVNKQTGDAIVSLRLEPSEEIESIKIRMINHLKLLKY